MGIELFGYKGISMIRDLSGEIRFMPTNAATIMERAGHCKILQTSASIKDVLEMPGFEQEKARWSFKHEQARLKTRYKSLR